MSREDWLFFIMDGTKSVSSHGWHAFESGFGMRPNLHRSVFLFEESASSGHHGAETETNHVIRIWSWVERVRVLSRKVEEEASKVRSYEVKQGMKRMQRESWRKVL